MKSFSEKHYNVIVLLSVLLFLVFNESVLVDLYHKWYAQGLTGPYAHGLLIVVIVAYLSVRKITELRVILKPGPSVLGMFLLADSQIVMFLARLADINFIQHLAIISSIICIIWSAYSFRIVKHFIIFALLLLFTLPVWGGIELPLQKISIFTTNAVLTLTGIPYYLEGSYFHFSSGVIQIAPECAGMQQMLVSMIIGLLFSAQFHLRFRDTVKTLLYLGIAAIIINTLRIIIIMIVGYYTKMESSLITKHLLLGWIIYGIGVYAFLYFYSGRKFIPAASGYKDNSGSSGAGFFRHHAYSLFVVLVMFVLFPTVFNRLIVYKINNQESRSVKFSQPDMQWQKKSQNIAINWHPDYPEADARYTATLSKDGDVIYLYINAYDHIKSGIEPVNMDNAAYNRRSWHLRKQNRVTVHTRKGKTVDVYLDLVVSPTSQPLLIMNFYLINGKVAANLAKAKVYTMLGLLHGRYDIKQVSVASLIRPGESVVVVANRLKTFFTTMRLD